MNKLWKTVDVTRLAGTKAGFYIYYGVKAGSTLFWQPGEQIRETKTVKPESTSSFV